MSRTCVITPKGWIYRDVLKKVLTELGLWLDPREDWQEVRLNRDQVEELDFHLEEVVIPHELYELPEPFLVTHLRGDDEAGAILRKFVDGKLFSATGTNGKAASLHGSEFFFYADGEGDEAILAKTFQPLLVAA